MARRIDVSPISGFPEWSPSGRLAEQRVMDTIRREFERFGYAPIETPAVERMSVLTAKGGIQRQIFSVGRPVDDASSDGPELGLHFDLTVPLARYVAQRANELTFPFRRYQMQKVWRGERAQRGRFREFHQCDVDIVGSGSLDLLHDAEIVRVIGAVFEAIGVPSFRVAISNRKVLTSLVETFAVTGEAADAVLRVIDKAGPRGPAATRQALVAEGHPEALAEAIERLIGAADLEQAEAVMRDAGAATDGIAELRTVRDAALLLGLAEDSLEVDLAIARGLDYYTGTVYETFVVGHEAWGSVCSGGRYDDLAGFFTNRKLPGVGVSIGLTRLLHLLTDSGLVQHGARAASRVLVTVQDRESYLSEYLTLADELRSAGIPTEMYLQDKRLGDQLSYAAAVGIPYVVIAGADELGRGVVTLRDMARGEQREVPREGVVAAVGGTAPSGAS